jgi:hypothetical protein
MKFIIVFFKRLGIGIACILAFFIVLELWCFLACALFTFEYRALGYCLNDFSDIEKFGLALGNMFFIGFVIVVGIKTWVEFKHD